jgi:hypothetical protein
MSTPWTPDQLKYLRDNHKTMTAAEIGSHIGKTRAAVWRKAYDLGLRKGAGRPQRKPKPEPKPKVREPKRFPWWIRASLEKGEAMC